MMSKDNGIRHSEEEFEFFYQTEHAFNMANELKAHKNLSKSDNVSQLVEMVRKLMEQNMRLVSQIQMNNNVTPTNAANVSMVPDLWKTIDQFDEEKDPVSAKLWLKKLKVSLTLHKWPEYFTFQVACSNLIVAANFRLRIRVAEITDWKKFVETFQRTFVYEESKTELWKRMQDQTQQMKENISLHFHEKVSLCKALDLDFPETKEQWVIGLWSRELGTFLMSKAHQDDDELFKDIMSFERVNIVRKTRISDHRMQGKKADRSTNLVEEKLENSPAADVAPLSISSYRIEATLKVENSEVPITPTLDTGSPIVLISEKLVPLHCPCTKVDTKQVIRHFKEYFSYHSKPLKVISHRATCFATADFKDFLNELDVEHNMISTGMPQANGQIERKRKYPSVYEVGDYVMITNIDVTPRVNKKLLPKFRRHYVITNILDNDRYVVNDTEGFQVTQMPYEGIVAPSRMKHWHRDNLEQ
ncbi:hypothetical protein Trydic_g1623 [Trypoxylus dichotomus]